MLHEDRAFSKDNKEGKENAKTKSDSGKTINSVCTYSQFRKRSATQVLLATAIIMIKDRSLRKREGIIR